jgi:hypothetical protein
LKRLSFTGKFKLVWNEIDSSEKGFGEWFGEKTRCSI